MQCGFELFSYLYGHLGQRPQNDDSSSKLIESEERNRGSISYRYYWYYLCQFGLCPSFFVCIVAILQNVAKAGTQFWLSAWSSAGAKLPSNATAVSRPTHPYLFSLRDIHIICNIIIISFDIATNT